MAGQQKIAEEMVVGIPTQVIKYSGSAYSYGSLNRDNAMILEAMVIMDKKEEAISLMKSISNALVKDTWMNTQTTAYSLMAMVKYMGDEKTSKEMNFSYSVDSEQKTSVNTQKPIKRISVKPSLLKDKKADISIVNKGESILFVRLMKEGIPLAGMEESKSSNLKMAVIYTDMSGNVINIDKMEQGKDFIVEVTVSNPNSKVYLQNLALTQVFPSGWEIINNRMGEGGNTLTSNIPEYQDIRDDRVLTYFNLTPYSSYGKGHKKTFKIVLNAAYTGEFYLPAMKVEAMYDNNFSANDKGKWVKVIKAN
jgi:uncharacterized protein YfaS (alpha-2-macroglobulin family)